MRLRIVAILGLLLALCAGSARAQDPSVSNEELLRRLNALESQMAQSSVLDEGSMETEGTPCPNLAAGAAIVFARPYFEGSVLALTMNERTVLSDANFNYKVSPKIWLAYTTCEDAGIMATYYQFDHSVGGVFPDAILNAPISETGNIGQVSGNPLTVSAGLELHTVDVDFFKQVDFGDIAIKYTIGTRYAHMQQDLQAVAAARFLSTHIAFDGVGPRIGFGSKAPLLGRLSAMGNVGTSILFGSARHALTDETGLVFRRKGSEPLGIVELQTGLEWSEQTDNGRIFAQILMDASLWANAGNLITDFNSFAMLGFGVAAGYEY